MTTFCLDKWMRQGWFKCSIGLSEDFVKTLGMVSGKEIGTGEFGAMMDVALINDGPVTIWIDSKSRE